jgi:uncharacterized protein involved in exopolysaccharide biosynthesis
VKFAQSFFVLRACWKPVSAVAGVFAVAALAASLALPEAYTAEVQLLIETQAAVPVSQPAPGELATQLDILRSDRVAQQVVSRLKLDRDPSIQARWREETGGRGELAAWYGRELGRHLTVVPRAGSGVVTLAFTGRDPQAAAAIANAFASAYAETNLELRMSAAPGYADGFDGSVRFLRETPASARPPRVTVLAPAIEPARPSGPEAAHWTLLGALFGGMLGAGLALLRERRRPRARGAADLSDRLGLPVLAVLPTVNRRDFSG